MGAGWVIDVDDPASADARALIEAHWAFTQAVTPAGHVHALSVEGLSDPSVSFSSARDPEGVIAIGALKELDRRHGEIRSMHTAVRARRRGVGRSMLDHLLCVAGERGYLRVSLETGTNDAFGPARALYRSRGFVECPPFADYSDNPFSMCMTLAVRSDVDDRSPMQAVSAPTGQRLRRPGRG